MPWYGWLFLVLLVAVVAAWVIWWLVLRARQAKIRAKVTKLEQDLERSLVVLEDARKAQVYAEEVITRKRLKELEEDHREELAKLSAEEKAKYEDLKKNPSLGVDYVLGLLSEDNGG